MHYLASFPDSTTSSNLKNNMLHLSLIGFLIISFQFITIIHTSSIPFTSSHNKHKHKQNIFHSFSKLFHVKGGARGGGTDSSMTEFYDILGLQKGKCSEKDIKKAYREKAMKMHPDRGGDTEEFKKLAEAYEVT